MGRLLRNIAIGLLIGMWVAMSLAAETPPPKETPPTELPKAQAKSLAVQIQDIKKDVLEISTELNQLEEKLLYPANTQISIFLALAQADKFRLDSVKIMIDGKLATHYLYTAKELEGLQNGGVQRVYSGNLRTGVHALEVSLTGKSANNAAYQHQASYKFTKDAGTKLVEITLAGPDSGKQGIAFRD